MYNRTRFDITYRLSVPGEDEIDPSLFAAQDLPKDDLTITPQVDQNAHVQYDVAYKLSERNQISQTPLHHLQSGNHTEMTISAEYEGNLPDDFTFLQIDVHQLFEGIYKLTVVVTDRHTGAQTEKNTLFRIVH
jgi:hypothetical protein